MRPWTSAEPWDTSAGTGTWSARSQTTALASTGSSADRLASGHRPTARCFKYTEDGELAFGSYHGPASRSLIYRGRPDGGADVRFADGREFYRLDLRSGSCEAEHPCRADQYLVTVTRRSPVSFTETWRVAGPDKDYELTATYTRPGAE